MVDCMVVKRWTIVALLLVTVAAWCVVTHLIILQNAHMIKMMDEMPKDGGPFQMPLPFPQKSNNKGNKKPSKKEPTKPKKKPNGARARMFVPSGEGNED